MIRKELLNGKVIISDQYGVYSFIRQNHQKVALVGCKDLVMNSEDERNYKIEVAENRPWCDDWSEDYKINLTRAEAKSILRHKAKEVRMWEDKHQMLCSYYYGALRKRSADEHNCWLNSPEPDWILVQL